MKPRIRPVHPFGPKVGAYRPGIATDIRRTFAAAKTKQNGPAPTSWFAAISADEKADLARTKPLDKR